MRLTNLVDAAAIHIADNEFYVPPKDRLDQLQPRDCVKICRNNERFWVQVSDCYGEIITGTVDNKLIMPVFERRHVYDVILRHLEETSGATL